MVETHQMQNGCMNVVGIDAFFDGFITKFVGGAVL